MKRYLIAWTVILLVTLTLIETAHARRIKIYRLPKEVVAGQLGLIIFENPSPELVRSQSKCTVEKLLGWSKSDMPILRFEQNGKQVWMPLCSYQTIGDSCIATFVAPSTLVAGSVTVFLINGSDPSVPSQLKVGTKLQSELNGIVGASVAPLGVVRVIGDGFVPEVFSDHKKLKDELEGNIALSKMSNADQWGALNHRIMKDWDKLPVGDYLLVEQAGKSWRCFVDECGVEAKGMTLSFVAPPDLQPGTATLKVVCMLGGTEAARSQAVTVSVQ